MKNIFSTAVLTVLLVCSYQATVLAQIGTGGTNGQENEFACSNTVFTAIPFLRINPDTRTGGMGEVGIATDPDVGAIFHNASKLAFSKNSIGATLTYTPWLRQLVDDIFIAQIAGYGKLNNTQAIGLSLRYFSLGSIQFTDLQGNDSGNYTPNEFAIDLAYSRRLADNFGAGVTLKYVRSALARGQEVGNSGNIIKAAQAAAADVSFYYTKDLLIGGRDSKLALGLAATNIGNKVSYGQDDTRDFIPANLGLGSNLTVALDEFNSFSFAFDINKIMAPTPNDSTGSYRNKSLLNGIFGSFGDAPGGFKEEMQELIYSVGVEYWYNNQIAFRLGHFNENKCKGNRKYLTVGLGAKYSYLGFNFAYIVPVSNQRNPLDNTMRFSLLFDLSDVED